MLLLEQAALRAGLLDDNTLADLRRDVVAEVASARDRAMSWPVPQLSALTEDVFA